MTTPSAQPISAQFGYTLALAERTLTRVLREHLAERGTEPETWYALQLVATRGPGLAREALSADLAGSRSLDTESTRELLARLESDGLIHGDSHVDLTPEGAALHRSLRDYVAVPRQRLLSEFDEADVETTIRTLQAITERALAGA
jgi:DNA-binding MarR family transcriptional regulator